MVADSWLSKNVELVFSELFERFVFNLLLTLSSKLSLIGVDITVGVPVRVPLHAADKGLSEVATSNLLLDIVDLRSTISGDFKVDPLAVEGFRSPLVDADMDLLADVDIVEDLPILLVDTADFAAAVGARKLAGAFASLYESDASTVYPTGSSVPS